MPRKTRQQKMAAKLRRMRDQLEEKDSPNISSKNDTEEKIQSSTYNVRDFDLELNEKSIDKSDKFEKDHFDYITSDVHKILVLSVISVAVEILLSLTINSQFAKLLLSRFGIEI